jgi:hypothetical protein
VCEIHTLAATRFNVRSFFGRCFYHGGGDTSLSPLRDRWQPPHPAAVGGRL